MRGKIDKLGIVEKVCEGFLRCCRAVSVQVRPQLDRNRFVGRLDWHLKGKDVGQVKLRQDQRALLTNF